MIVDVMDNWEVTYSGRTIMSTVDSGYWPACMPGCSNLKPFQQEMAFALNAAFRWCPGGGDSNALFAAPLGCDGADGNATATGSTAVAAELNAIKWRVMQSLWTMGASAGFIPPGLFQIPIPFMMDAGSSVPYLPIQAVGMYEEKGSFSAGQCIAQNGKCLVNGWVVDPGSNGDLEAIAVGTVYDVPDAFTHFTYNAPNEIPRWYRTLYAAPPGGASLKHKFTGISGRNFSQCNYQSANNNRQVDTSSCDMNNDGTPFSLASLVDRLDVAGGCRSYGHIVEVPGFGRILLGELVVSCDAVQLIGIRAELGCCPVRGKVTAALVGGGGTHDN